MLGKAVKDLKSTQMQTDDKSKRGGPNQPQEVREAFSTTENEAFLKMKEDPLVFIKQRELEARSQVYDNPLKMKQIKAEIEALKLGKSKKKHKKDKKDKKKHKKEKKEKKKKNGESSRNSSKSKSSKHSRRTTSGGE